VTSLRDRVAVARIADADDRARALEVLRATYREEKGWVGDEAEQLPDSDLARGDVSWFVASVDHEPVGVLRVLYDPPLGLYADYGLQFIGQEIDVEAFVRQNKIAEIGRFAVVPDFRRHIIVVAALMRAAVTETVAQGYTHYITDVFEDDPHSPYNFHTRVLGFVPVATHEVGELNCRSRRITLVLDLRACYERMRASGGWIFRYFTASWEPALHRRLSGSPSHPLAQ